MPVNVKLKDVAQPQRLDALVAIQDPDPTHNPFTVPADRRVQIVYTGWLGATFGTVALARDQVLSFVPHVDVMDKKLKVQTFLPANSDLGDVQAVVMASLSSFGSGPSTAAVDHASIATVHKSIPGVGDDLGLRVLVVTAQVAADGGEVHGIAYQVTVLANPQLLGPALILGKGPADFAG
jgi:hypothetical protein